jgi:hypothetical protein
MLAQCVSAGTKQQNEIPSAVGAAHFLRLRPAVRPLRSTLRELAFHLSSFWFLASASKHTRALASIFPRRDAHLSPKYATE